MVRFTLEAGLSLVPRNSKGPTLFSPISCRMGYYLQASRDGTFMNGIEYGRRITKDFHICFVSLGDLSTRESSSSTPHIRSFHLDSPPDLLRTLKSMAFITSAMHNVENIQYATLHNPNDETLLASSRPHR